MDALLDLVIEHARGRCAEVWPGGTVDVDDIHWFWNTRLSSSAGIAYPRRNPKHGGEEHPAIGLAPDYYYQFGLDGLLKTVRHELIHQWQYEHPDGGYGGHGPKFRQWVDDLDTTRHCQHWNKQTYAADLTGRIGLDDSGEKTTANVFDQLGL